MSAIPDARILVHGLLDQALHRSASDLHIEPTGEGYDVRMRMDGLLVPVQQVSSDEGKAAVIRLMVMANLLTYRLDIPQEGRLTLPTMNKTEGTSARLAIMPTALGLRAVLRLPAELTQPRHIDDLGLPPTAIAGLKRFATQDSGMLIVTGPAGSGKTTTVYAMLDYLAHSSGGLSIVSLEDPVERHLPGITQIEVSPFGELTYERALRSILRQDPQVLALGEIRDAATASLAMQAALTGHRLICTLHASTPAGAVARLLEMGIEPYQITSSVYGVMTQRLLRRLKTVGSPGDYAGRVPVAEFSLIDEAARHVIMSRPQASQLEQSFAKQQGHVTMSQVAVDLQQRGVTDGNEIRRVLGT